MQLSHHHQPQGYKSSLKHHDSPLLTAEKEGKEIADVNFLFVFGILKIYFQRPYDNNNQVQVHLHT